jgi:hypothetical protein
LGSASNATRSRTNRTPSTCTLTKRRYP